VVSASNLLQYNGVQQEIMSLSGITVDKMRKSANNGLTGDFGDGWPAQSHGTGSGRDGLI
jgi:hypothetical protein